MGEFDRAAAVDRVETLVERVEDEVMPVPIRELWVYGDVALGLDPVERLDVYLTKDLLFGSDDAAEAEFGESHGVEGVGTTVRAEWAREHPDAVRANANGHVAPERCLAAHLGNPDEPIHFEVCNASFEDNVTQRLRGALERERYAEILDPRGVCCWKEGRRSEEALEKLAAGEFAFPTLPDALEMLGLEPERADEAAEAVRGARNERDGLSVRGDVV